MSEAHRAKRLPGRPTKPVPRGKKRIQISMIVSAETKAFLDQEAKRSGRTVSQVGEEQIARARTFERDLRALGAKSLGDLNRQNFEAEMWRRGYRKLRDPYGGYVWLPPEAPIERGGFIAYTEEERAALEARGEKVFRPDDMTDEEWAQFNEDRNAGRIKDEPR